MLYYTPTEQQIQTVMHDTRLDRLQALRHLQQRYFLQTQLRSRPNPYPLGKSQNDA